LTIQQADLKHPHINCLLRGESLAEMEKVAMIGLGGPTIGLEEKIAVWRQLSSGNLAQGAKVEEFERKFADWSGCKNVVAVNSGTSALHIGNLALGIGPGDEVIVPSFTFAASANSIALTGAAPIFCDVDPVYFTLDVREARSLITEKTKAIMVVHLYGQMADMVAVNKLAKEFNLLIIEDAAQAHGASLNGTPAGAWGNFGAFSFYPTKNMTTGEGGALTTGSEDTYRYAKLLRNQGMAEKYKNEIVGLNNRMTELEAVIGLAQLKKVAGFNSRRIRNAHILSEMLAGLRGLKIPEVRPGSKHVFHQYTILVEHERDELSEQLLHLGIQSATYYPTPVHRLPAFRMEADLPITEMLASSCLSLPIHPSLSRSKVERVGVAVRKVLGA
jgi:dTDP-4-amino-4,6-dideoxygalactose transaminase